MVCNIYNLSLDLDPFIDDDVQLFLNIIIIIIHIDNHSYNLIYMSLIFFSQQEFEDYYEGVSLGFESDEEFTAMMRNCWSI